MRDDANIDDIHRICIEFGKYKEEMITHYGVGNENRLTGNHETAHIDDYTWGVSDRSASIRIPMTTANKGNGHIEDRRPAANIDPYEAVGVITKYMNIIEKEVAQPSLFV
jgi:glutamine synthetase